MITKEEITLNDFLIPANFEDSGKIMGLFSTRNVVEAVILLLPFAFCIFNLVPLSLTWKIILSSVFVIPIGGFALMGIRDDPLSIFVRTWFEWRKNRKILEYRGEIDRNYNRYFIINNQMKSTTMRIAHKNGCRYRSFEMVLSL